MRASIVDTFLEKFQLKAAEVQVLRGTRDGTLHPDFFAALNRVKQIHTDCKVLLRTNQQTAGYLLFHTSLPCVCYQVWVMLVLIIYLLSYVTLLPVAEFLFYPCLLSMF